MMLLLGVIIAMEAGVGGVMYGVLRSHVASTIDSSLARVQADITFDGKVWRTGKYITDPTLPGALRIYVLSNSGNVIDRRQPIAGFLDTADYRQFTRYTTPQTVHALDGQAWRIYSEPVTDRVGNVGVVTASYPLLFSVSDMSEVDQKLTSAVDEIARNTHVHDDNITVGSIRNISTVGVHFQVVNQYGQVLIRNDHVLLQPPDFIDSTHVLSAMQHSSPWQVRDTRTGERFLVVSRPLVDAQGIQRGVVVAGRSLAYTFYTMKVVVCIVLALDVLGLLLLSLLLRRRLPIVRAVEAATKKIPLESIQSISFSKEENAIRVNGHTIPITYATNQYYLCQAIFSARKKRWATDEIVEKFGEHHDRTSWRKVYDAMISLNKKAMDVMEPRIIISNNKTFQLNPDLLDKVDRTP